MMSEQLAGSGVREENEPTDEASPETVVAEYRYPGVPPFADSDMDRLLFKGRTAEVDQVLHSILSFDLFLIYGVSGLGKTSLLTAGVLEPLRQRDFFPVILRLNDSTSSPVELIDEQIREAADKAEGITVTRHPSARGVERPPSSLWDLLSEIEVWKGNTLQRLVLIFDQFEELFTLGWSDDQRDQFIEQLGQVIRRHRPTPSVEANGAVMLPPPQVKITLIIREDFLGELEALAKQVPQIMAHRFRLDGLKPDQAERAIREPAQVSDPRLTTPRFRYSEGAAQAILGFLGAREERGRPVATRSIDPSQLQIICQHVERSILPDKAPATDDGAIVEISEDDLGGTNGLERILRDFYRREVSAFAPKERKLVRNLCEVGLINQSGRRLSLEEGEIETKFNVKKSTLEGLVARRLLRAEPRVGSVYYELAHDTLAAPILAYRQAVRSARRRHWIWALVALAAVVAIIVFALLASSSGGDAASNEIQVGDRVPSTIDGTPQVFDFNAPDKGTFIVQVVPLKSLDAVLEVTGPNEFFVQADNGLEGGTEVAVVEATAPGHFRILVSGSGSTTGGFELSIGATKVTDLTVGGDAVPGAVEPAKPAEVFQFAAAEDQIFVVEVVPDKGLDAVLEVTGPGDFLDQKNDASRGDPEVSVVRGTTLGSYRVVVTGSLSSGKFDVSVRAADMTEIGVGQAASSGSIETANPVEVFEFPAPNDQTLVVEVVPDSALNAVLEVTSPDGFVQSSDNAFEGGVETALLGPTVQGRYRVVITGLSAGSFQLFVHSVDVGVVTIGDAGVSGTIDPANPVGVFEFDAPSDQVVIAEVVPDKSLDAILEVTGPDGFGQAADNAFEGGTETSLLAPTVQGRYRVVVSGRSSGAFELSVRRVEVGDLTVGDAGVSGRIDAASPVGVFEFEAPSDQTFVVDVVPDKSLDAMLEVTGPDDSLQQADNAAEGGIETSVLNPTLQGRYRVVVTGRSSGGFKLTVRAPDIVTMTVGDKALAGTIEATNPVAVFEFTAPAGQSFVVAVVPDSGLDATLVVTDPNGSIEQTDNAIEGGAETTVLPATLQGRYRVVVTGLSSGSFQLTVRAVEVTDLTVAGTAATGTIEAANQIGMFEFEAPDDGTYVVEVVPGSSLDAMLDVTDANGVVQTADWGAEGGIETAVIDGTVGGRYRVVVSRFESTTGNYEVSVRPLAVGDVTVGGAAISGTIEKSSPVAVYAFEGSADQTFTVEVVPGPAFHPVLEVTDHNSNLASVWDDVEGSTQTAQVVGASDGRYLVLVRGFKSTTGKYNLSVRSP